MLLRQGELGGNPPGHWNLQVLIQGPGRGVPVLPECSIEAVLGVGLGYNISSLIAWDARVARAPAGNDISCVEGTSKLKLPGLAELVKFHEGRSRGVGRGPSVESNCSFLIVKGYHSKSS